MEGDGCWIHPRIFLDPFQWMSFFTVVRCWKCTKHGEIVPYDGKLSKSAIDGEFGRLCEEVYGVVEGFPVIYSVVGDGVADTLAQENGDGVAIVNDPEVVDGYIPVVDIDTVMKGLDYEHTLYSISSLGVDMPVYKSFLDLTYYGVRFGCTRRMNKIL